MKFGHNLLAGLVLATYASSPASAKIYTYTVGAFNDKSLKIGSLSIDTSARNGILDLTNDRKIQFSSDDLSRFKGDNSPFSASLLGQNISGTVVGKRGRISRLIVNSGQTGRFSFDGGRMSFIVNPFSTTAGGYTMTFDGWVRQGYTDLETDVPEPSSILFFGLGIAGIMIARRRWSKTSRGLEKMMVVPV